MKRKRPARWIALLLPALVLGACSKGRKPESEAPAPAQTSNVEEPPAAPPTRPAPAAPRGVKAEMRNVKFHLTDQAAAHLELINGELWPTGKNEMPNFDDKTSFEFRVGSGKVSITPRSLAAILNGYVFANSDAPLKDLSVNINGDRLMIKGKLHSKGDISFETAGTLSVTPDGRIRMATDKVKALHVPVKGVMGLFGIELAKVINTSKIPGIDTDKNDLLMDLSTLLPPPHIRGKLSAVGLEPNAIVTWFGDAATLNFKPGAETDRSYMAFQGNSVRFGKLTMQDTDLRVLGLDPADELDWNQDHYKEQLAAGYAKTTASLGLRAYVKDYAKLPRAKEGTDTAPPPSAPPTSGGSGQR
jgi:hypothetical protein